MKYFIKIELLDNEFKYFSVNAKTKESAYNKTCNMISKSDFNPKVVKINVFDKGLKGRYEGYHLTINNKSQYKGCIRTEKPEKFTIDPGLIKMSFMIDEILNDLVVEECILDDLNKLTFPYGWSCQESGIVGCNGFHVVFNIEIGEVTKQDITEVKKILKQYSNEVKENNLKKDRSYEQKVTKELEKDFSKILYDFIEYGFPEYKNCKDIYDFLEVTRNVKPLTFKDICDELDL